MQVLIEDLIEAARLLGATQAKKGIGYYTREDARFERVMRESISDKAKRLLAALRAEKAEDEAMKRDALADDLLADLRWLGSYLAEHYPIGRPDIGGRICIGNACGATWEEAVRAGRELHERAAAAYAKRMGDFDC